MDGKVKNKPLRFYEGFSSEYHTGQSFFLSVALEGITTTIHHAQPCTVFGKNVNEHLDMSPFTIHSTVKIQPSHVGPGQKFF